MPKKKKREEPKGTGRNQNNDKALSTSVEYDPYVGLDENYKKAIELRLRNVEYKDIASLCNAGISTVKHWFMSGGFLDEAYKWRAKIQDDDREERNKRIQAQLEDASSAAVNVLTGIVRNEIKAGSMAKVSAASKILDVSGFTPPIKIDTGESEELKLFRELISQNERILKSKKGTGANIPGRQSPGRMDAKTKGNR
jgi:hypothetical protein